MRCNVCNRLKFGNISKKDLLRMENVKNGYPEFDHGGTLNKSSRDSLTIPPLSQAFIGDPKFQRENMVYYTSYLEL